MTNINPRQERDAKTEDTAQQQNALLGSAERMRVAEMAAEYMALAASLSGSSSKAEYQRANSLSLLLAMILPGLLYMKVAGAAFGTPESNPMAAAVAMREWTGAAIGELDAADLAWHAPGIGAQKGR